MKIAVIGAGPGGLYAALAAARKNITVDLFEKRKVGEGIVCGECIFDSLGIMTRPGRGLLHPVKGLVLKAGGEYRFPWGVTSPCGCSIAGSGSRIFPVRPRRLAFACTNRRA